MNSASEDTQCHPGSQYPVFSTESVDATDQCLESPKPDNDGTREDHWTSITSNREQTVVYVQNLSNVFSPFVVLNLLFGNDVLWNSSDWQNAVKKCILSENTALNINTGEPLFHPAQVSLAHSRRYVGPQRWQDLKRKHREWTQMVRNEVEFGLDKFHLDPRYLNPNSRYYVPELLTGPWTVAKRSNNSGNRDRTKMPPVGGGAAGSKTTKNAGSMSRGGDSSSASRTGNDDAVMNPTHKTTTDSPESDGETCGYENEESDDMVDPEKLARPLMLPVGVLSRIVHPVVSEVLQFYTLPRSKTGSRSQGYCFACFRTRELLDAWQAVIRDKALSVGTRKLYVDFARISTFTELKEHFNFDLNRATNVNVFWFDQTSDELGVFYAKCKSSWRSVQLQWKKESPTGGESMYRDGNDYRGGGEERGGDYRGSGGDDYRGGDLKGSDPYHEANKGSGGRDRGVHQRNYKGGGGDYRYPHDYEYDGYSRDSNFSGESYNSGPNYNRGSSNYRGESDNRFFRGYGSSDRDYNLPPRDYNNQNMQDYNYRFEGRNAYRNDNPEYRNNDNSMRSNNYRNDNMWHNAQGRPNNTGGPTNMNNMGEPNNMGNRDGNPRLSANSINSLNQIVQSLSNRPQAAQVLTMLAELLTREPNQENRRLEETETNNALAAIAGQYCQQNYSNDGRGGQQYFGNYRGGEQQQQQQYSSGGGQNYSNNSDNSGTSSGAGQQQHQHQQQDFSNSGQQQSYSSGAYYQHLFHTKKPNLKENNKNKGKITDGK